VRLWNVSIVRRSEPSVSRKYIVEAMTSSMALDFVRNDAEVGRITDIDSVYITLLEDTELLRPTGN
jgi:hypothetical protein